MPFILGRPLGAPNNPELQHRILDAALTLLARTDGPVFEYYEEDAPAISEEEEQWVCPVSFANATDHKSLADTVITEIALLKPWYDKGRNERATTSFGVSGMALNDIVVYLNSFLSADVPTESNTGEMLKHAVEDLKAFYNEAATSQPGKSTAQELEDWYWQKSHAGSLVREVRKVCLESVDNVVKFTAKALLVPATQLHE